MNICIIPARGGSKRIPRKNIKIFAGKPMMAHSIIAAHQSRLFERVIVSTDDQEIMHVANSYGAETPFVRPEECANDYASTEDVILNALNWLKKHSQLPEYFCCIYPTAPFVTSKLLCNALDLLKQNNATTSFPVTTFASPIFRALQINKNGNVEAIWPEHTHKRSQDLPEAYHDAGQFYWGHCERFIEEKQLYSADSVPLVISRKLVCDIDTPDDWELAELMHQLILNSGSEGIGG